MKDYWEVRLSGAGGQGLMLAGAILAEAAGIYDGKEVVQTRSYGPESRGGASRSEVIISDDPIDYPQVAKPHVVLAMTQEAYHRYSGSIRSDGVLIIDPLHVEPGCTGEGKFYSVPITDIARDEIGAEITANVVALGVIVGLTGMVSYQAAQEAVKTLAPGGTAELNLKALAAGYEKALETLA